MSKFTYVGRAILVRASGDVTRRFRGRVLRNATTGEYRFVVNRLSNGKVPAGWPEAAEWTDTFEMKDVEWIGKQSDGV